MSCYEHRYKYIRIYWFFKLLLPIGKVYVVFNISKLHLEPFQMQRHMEITLKDYGNDALYHFPKWHVNTITQIIKGNATQTETLGENSPGFPLHPATQQINAKKQLLPLGRPACSTLQRSLRSLRLTICKMYTLKSSGSDSENHKLFLYQKFQGLIVFSHKWALNVGNHHSVLLKEGDGSN